MKTKVLHTLFLLHFLCGVNLLFAQPNSKVDSTVSVYINDLSKIWDNYSKTTFDNLLQLKNNKPTNINTQNSLQQLNKKNNLLLTRNILQQNIYKKDVGLSLTGGYQFNLRPPFADQDDIIAFRQRALVGLEWDILHGGFFDNRTKIKMLKSEYDYLKSKPQLEKNNRAFLIKSEQVVAHFNTKKIEVLNKRKELNKKQLEVDEKLWAFKQLTKDDYLKAVQHKTDINGQFELYESFSNNAEKLEIVKDENLELPLLDIKFEQLILSVNSLSHTTADSILPQHVYDNAKYESQFIRQIGLKTYTRYNFYDVYAQSAANRSFVSFGLNFNVPLTFNSKEKRELYLVNKKLEAQQQNTISENGTEFLMLNYYYEYRYKLKKYFNLLEKRNALAEFIRTEQVKKEFSDIEFNPNRALFLLDDYWSNTIELLDLHQDMYKILLNIKEKLPNTEIQEFTFPVTIQNDVKDTSFILPNTRAIYIWSKSLNKNNLDMIAEYCDLNNFNDIILSYKYDKEYIQTLNEFISKNYTKKITLMIGNNKLIHGGIQSFLDTLKSNITPHIVREIHLDIEPHTFDDFKQNKESYFNKYIELLKTTSTFCKKNNLQLSVSIPLNYPDSVLKEIFKFSNRVYLMAYENIDEDYIKRKIEEEINLDSNKVVLALRTKDFETRLKMDEHFLKLKIKNVAYHDIEGLIELDKKSIQVKDK